MQQALGVVNWPSWGGSASSAEAEAPIFRAQSFGRELVQALYAVERHANDRGACGVESFHIFGKFARLNVAALRIRRGIEIDDDVALL